MICVNVSGIVLLEIGGEDSMYFHELRWGTWKDKKFDNNRNGLMQMWGETTYTWYWLGDQCWSWPIPAKENGNELEFGTE